MARAPAGNGNRRPRRRHVGVHHLDGAQGKKNDAARVPCASGPHASVSLHSIVRLTPGPRPARVRLPFLPSAQGSHDSGAGVARACPVTPGPPLTHAVAAVVADGGGGVACTAGSSAMGES
eukprot:gene17353-biopygen3850